MASTRETMTSSDHARQLEHKYIELLEKRIASLEDVIKEAEAKRPADENPLKSFQAEKAGLINGDYVEDHNERNKSGSGPHPMTRLRERVLSDDGVPKETDIDLSEFEFLDRQPSSGKDAGLPGTSYKLTWYRIVSEKKKYQYSELKIDSPELQALLQIALSHYPKLHLPSDGAQDGVTFKGPFMPLIHNWNKLELLTNNESAEYRRLRTLAAEFDPKADDESNHLGSALVHLGKEDNLNQARIQLYEMLSRVKLTPELRSYFSGLDRQSKEKLIQFDYLWTIFPPGEVVYSAVFMNEPQLFIVKEGHEDFESSGSETKTKRVWKLVCWSYDWNGRTFDRVPVEFSFDEFRGYCSIETLDAFPLRLLGKRLPLSTEQLEDLLIQRGKRFRDVCIKGKGWQMFDYEGEAIPHGVGFQKMEKRNENGSRDWDSGVVAPTMSALRQRVGPQPTARSQKIDGRVMVDFAAYLQHAAHSPGLRPMGGAHFSDKGEECRCSICSFNQALQENQKTHWDGVMPGHKFEDLQLMLCPPRVLGCHLESRTWVELNVALEDKKKGQKRNGKHLKDIEQLASAEVFDRLQLARSHKNLIRDLVLSHASGGMNKPLIEDIMKGKGKGLVILLHGPPGVGKTLTAESVAQLAGKPLLSVGVSVTGLNPEDVEKNLEVFFELAMNWQAVLVLDEADVFLESRSSHTSDLNRNALVSVLLRVLEYYSGILILTTNRVNQFDIGVQSRVNLGIRYTDLTRTQKMTIFEGFIQDIDADKIEDRRGILDWFETDSDAMDYFDSLNGRQIRNILFSAASLAMKDGEMLRLKHIQDIARSTFAFQDSLRAVVQLSRSKNEAGTSF